ncbi:unnamed protein product [Rodentolepis nana]|uniref:Reverse transcriptase domain-containing protein n=1 Tax=Rodentolepis nana TaxID=102285 RepID=A0A0R3U085_RODNA|nr:unnamed protein product [Rodentolepis nana]
MIRCAKKTIPRGKTKHYRVFWSKHLEELKRKRDALRNTADQTGRTDDVQARRRPISLTSVLAKLMERMVNRRLTCFLDTNNILRSGQAGLRPQRSTNQQVATFSQHIKDALDARNTLTAVFVDFKSAYDLVWKEKLILKLAKIGIKHNMLNWVKAFIGQRSCKVRYENALSKSNLLQTGLPQGAVTSCTLFNVFINDTVELVQTVTGIKGLLDADDLVLWYSASKKNARERTESALNCALKLLANLIPPLGKTLRRGQKAPKLRKTLRRGRKVP